MKKECIGSMALLLLAICGPARGATEFIVNRTVDREDSNPGDGSCIGKGLINNPQSPGLCTLRAAVNEVNKLARTFGDEQFIIKIKPGVYQLHATGSEVAQEMSDDLGLLHDLDITAKRVQIVGIAADGGAAPAHARPVIRAFDNPVDGFRVFDIDVDDDEGETEFTDIVISNGFGRGTKGGAAIACRGGGYITLARSRISTNASDFVGGGAINSACDLEITDTAINNNDGNGIVLRPNKQGLALVMRSSSVTDNSGVGMLLAPSAVQDCGGFGDCDVVEYNLNATVLSSTLARNASGVLMSQGTIFTANSSTFANNQHYGIHVTPQFEFFNKDIGDIHWYGYGSHFVNVTLSNNAIVNSSFHDFGQDEPWNTMALTFVSLGFNHIGRLGGIASFASDGDIVGGGAIAPLEPVYASAYTTGLRPPEDSVLIAGGSDRPVGEAGSCTQHDQAGESRGFLCDIGALERDHVVALPELDPPQAPGAPEDLPPGTPPEQDPQDDFIFMDSYE